AQANCKPSQK
ncbi:binding--dependent transport system inner membrane component family protein, partial [Vibrio parahaemolyticus V-223/04]